MKSQNGHIVIIFCILGYTILPIANADSQVNYIIKSLSVTQLPESVMPKRSDSMTQVKTSLGEPIKILKAVGKPPITRWVYNDFTVYYEYDKVIHTVIKRK